LVELDFRVTLTTQTEIRSGRRKQGVLVDEFECWLRDHEQRLVGHGYGIEFVRSDQAPVPTAHITLDAKDHGAFIAVRNDGLFDLEVLDYDSGDLILTDHREFETAEEMLATLNRAREYLAALSEGGL
jgi:hypothetical protein